MKYKLAIFDLDGTILDTLDDLTSSVNFALEQCDYPKRSKDEIRRFLGNGAQVLLTKSVPKGSGAEDIAHALEIFKKHYGVHCNDLTSPYPGIPQLFTDLRRAGCRVAVVSNKPDYAVQILCQRHFPAMLDAFTGQRSDVRKKPAPDSINHVLDKLSIDRNDSVYIGDSEVDIDTARNAEMDCISVDWGFRDHDFLINAGATTIASSVDKLKELLM